MGSSILETQIHLLTVYSLWVLCPLIQAVVGTILRCSYFVCKVCWLTVLSGILCFVFQVDSANKHGILLEVVQVLTDLDLTISIAYIFSKV